MTQPNAPARRNPALIFAAAAVAVVALALPLFLWNNQGSPVGGDTSTSSTVAGPSTSTTVPGSTTTTIAGSTTTTAGKEVVAVWPVFFVQEPARSPTGNPALVPFDVAVYSDEDVPGDLVDSPEDLLFNLNLLSFEVPAGFVSAVPEGVEVVGKSFETTAEGLTRAVLDMNEAFLDGANGLLGDFTMLNQIIYTTLQFEVAEVRFTVGGQPIEAFGTEGISLVDPVDSSTFRDELNPIFLLSPVTATEEEFSVFGVANVFEAVVSYRVPGTDIDGFAMATCGTGCWGAFEFTFPRDGVPAGSVVEIFADSAEDGAPMFVISIPLDRATISGS